MGVRNLIVIAAWMGMALSMAAQGDDLLSLLPSDKGDNKVEYVTASFKTDHVINLHSLENAAAGALDIKIEHRFGFISGGAYELWGLDQASIRIGGDYGITNCLMVGAGRSSYEKTYDAFAKLKFLRQSTGARNMPVTACLLGTIAAKTVHPPPDQVNYFSSKLYYTGQLIIGRKFSKIFSLQLSPTIVHRNLVTTADEKNDVFAIGAGARFKLGKRTSINGEYIYVFPNQLAPGFRNSLSLGFDIETGGHVFQMHFTNSTSMIEKGFICENVGDWGAGDIHFGFNISRTFNVK